MSTSAHAKVNHACHADSIEETRFQRLGSSIDMGLFRFGEAACLSVHGARGLKGRHRGSIILPMLCFVSPCSELIKVLSPPGKGFAEKSQPQELPFPAWQTALAEVARKGAVPASWRPFNMV